MHKQNIVYLPKKNTVFKHGLMTATTNKQRNKWPLAGCNLHISPSIRYQKATSWTIYSLTNNRKHGLELAQIGEQRIRQAWQNDSIKCQMVSVRIMISSSCSSIWLSGHSGGVSCETHHCHILVSESREWPRHLLGWIRIANGVSTEAETWLHTH
jgi:hypothetical protein